VRIRSKTKRITQLKEGVGKKLYYAFIIEGYVKCHPKTEARFFAPTSRAKNDKK